MQVERAIREGKEMQAFATQTLGLEMFRVAIRQASLTVGIKRKNYCWACSMDRCDLVTTKDNTCECCRNGHSR